MKTGGLPGFIRRNSIEVGRGTHADTRRSKWKAIPIFLERLMKTTTVLASLLLLFTSPALTAAEPARQVTVDGKGAVSVSPDMARINMSVEARNLDIDAAKMRVNDVSAEFLALCRKLDIDESKVRSTELSIYPEYRWNDDSKQQELLAYRVNRQLEVELADLDDLAELMEGAVEAGVNNVSPPRLMSSRERDLHREALALAAEDAKANAQQLADALGVRLGDVLEISASQQIMPPPMLRTAALEMAASADAGQVYNSGEIRFEANVTARFELLAE